MKTTPLNPIQQLRAGAIGVLATDTLYGLVACALNQTAVQRVYQVKGRAPGKPCIILIPDISDLIKFGVHLTDHATSQLVSTLWPGPVSIVFPCDQIDFEYLHRGTATLAFRLPADEELRALLRATGPLIAPSANPEGQPPAKTIEEAIGYFGERVDFYLDSGLRTSEPSTLVEIQNGKVVVLRQGLATIPKEVR